MFQASNQASSSKEPAGEDIFLLALSDRLRRIDDPLEVLHEAAAAVGRHLGANRAGYAEVEADQGTFVVKGDWTDGSVAPGTGQRTIASFGTRATAMLYAGETQTIEDATTDDRVQGQDLSAFEAMRIVAAITVPLVKDGRLVAMFSVHKSSPRHWREAEIRLVEQVAEWTWAAHERARTSKRLRDSESRLAFLLELSDRTRGETSAEVILATTASLLASHLRAARITYGEVDEAADRIEVKHAWGYGLEALPRSHRMSMFGTELIASHRAGLTYVTEDASTDPMMSPEGQGVAGSLRTRAMVTVPLVRDGAITAYLSVHDVERRRWTDDEIRLIREVAERTWATLARAHAEDELRRRESTRAFLLSLADQTRLLASPEAILAVTTDLLSAEVEVDAAGYSSLDWSRGTVRASHFRRRDAEAFHVEHPISVLAGELLAAHTEGRVFRSGDVANDPRISAETKEICRLREVRAILSAPLVKDDQLVGLLSLSHNAERSWTEEEAVLLAEVAERTWANLDRAVTGLKLRDRDASAAFLLALGDRLRECTSAHEMLQSAVEAIGLRLGVNRVGYAEIDDLADTLTVDVEWGDGSLISIAGTYPLAAFGQGHVTALRRGEITTIEDVRTDERVGEDGRPAVEALQVKAGLTVPLVRDGRLVALLSAHHGEPRAWSAAEVHLVREVAERTWAIVERARAEAELARSQEALYQSEKMTALGSLLAGLSHEMNNPLSVVVLQSVMMEEDAAGSPLGTRARRIREAAERCSKIVATFLAMARQRPPQRAVIDINEAIDSALGLAAYGLRSSGVVVDRQLGSGLPQIEADPDQLHQVFVNLVINAQHALQGVDRERRLRIATRYVSGSRAIVVDVTDNGPGVAADVRRRIFEPFFTTKPQGSGTGLGLSFSLGVVEAHGGKLELLDGESGATFRITLPATTASTEKDQSSPDLEDKTAIRPALALVVDDEVEIADSLAELLERDGYQVRITSSGNDAKTILGSQDYDLILSDLRMPDGDGPSLYAWLMSNRPHLAMRSGFVTGDTIEPGARQFLAEAGRPVLEKPFTPSALRAFVAAILEGRK